MSWFVSRARLNLVKVTVVEAGWPVVRRVIR